MDYSKLQVVLHFTSSH